MNKFKTDKKWIVEASKIVIWKIEEKINIYKLKNNGKNESSVIFLAWAPWAWKTEFIKSLPKKIDFFFLDIDSYRDFFLWYKWNNSKDFQKAISWVINEVVKYCLKNDIKFILDWTFKSLEHVKRNLDNCKRRKRKIEIYFIFQDPYISYYFTFLRELKQQRNIPFNWFVECFYNSIENVFYAKNKFKDSKLYICEKIPEKWKLFWKKDYKIHENIIDLTNFCKKYNIGYNWNQFTNKKILEKWIKDYNKFLSRLKWLFKIFLLFKKSLWQKKQEK